MAALCELNYLNNCTSTDTRYKPHVVKVNSLNVPYLHTATKFQISLLYSSYRTLILNNTLRTISSLIVDWLEQTTKHSTTITWYCPQALSSCKQVHIVYQVEFPKGTLFSKPRFISTVPNSVMVIENITTTRYHSRICRVLL